MKQCPKCGVIESYKKNDDFVFECHCGFKWRETFPCPACGGEATRGKEGYYCISSGCCLKHWTPTVKDTEDDFKVVFGEGWNKIAYLPDETLCFLCNSPVLKQENASKCQNESCDIFGQKVHIYRIADASCNPSGDTDAQKDGGKTLLKALETKVLKAHGFTYYETQASRYRNTEKTLAMLTTLRGKVSEITGEASPANPEYETILDSLDKVIKQVESSSPFHQ